MAHNKYLKAYRDKKIGTRPPRQGPGYRDQPDDKPTDPPKAEKPATPSDKPKGSGGAKHDKTPATPPADAPTKG